MPQGLYPAAQPSSGKRQSCWNPSLAPVPFPAASGRRQSPQPVLALPVLAAQLSAPLALETCQRRLPLAGFWGTDLTRGTCADTL